MKFKRKSRDEYIPLSVLWGRHFGVLENIKFLTLEMLFAKQLIQLMSNTSANAKEEEIGALAELSGGNKPPAIGQVSGVEKFIPSSLMTKIVEPLLAELLIKKYASHYGFLVTSDGEPYITPEDGPIDVTNTLFRVNKSISHQFVSYIGKIEFIFLMIESISVAGIWLATHRLEYAIMVAGIFEFIRRFKI